MACPYRNQGEASPASAQNQQRGQFIASFAKTLTFATLATVLPPKAALACVQPLISQPKWRLYL